MYKQERYDRILSILQLKGSATVNYLVDALYVSPATVRRDLQALSEQGLVHHYYGGATLIQDASKAPPIEVRHQENHSAKQQIGQKALSLISDGDCLFIDASSTCLCMVPGLHRFKNLTVVTNSQWVLEALADMNITVYSTGGKLLRHSMAYTGPIAEACMQSLRFDKCFFSCQSISKEGDLSDGGEAENQIHRLVMQQKGTRILLCDKRKFGRSSMFKLGNISDLDYIVTEADLYADIDKPEGRAPVLVRA
ncbi:MAG: DeoR/GlpR transcriptional regulator [Clostridiales bacterium]|nr:DeoR/GlpR transcriptional regulator [Clostridiales bacterium]